MKRYNRIFEEDKMSYLDSEIDEMKRVSRRKYKDLYSKFSKSKTVLLPDFIWNKLENTDSNELEVGDFQKASELANKYGRDLEYAIKTIKDDSYNPPLIYQKGKDSYTLVAGNTRLMAAKILGIRPRVLIISKLSEDYFTSDLKPPGATFEIFKNPDTGEAKEMRSSTYVYLRGVLVGENVYVSSEHCLDGETPVIHADILRVLKDKGIINEYSSSLSQDHMIDKYFCFYIENDNEITISGSYSYKFMRGETVNLKPFMLRIKQAIPWCKIKDYFLGD
jgi:hypothetical protein